MRTFTPLPERTTRLNLVSRTQDLLHDLDLIATSPMAAFPCRSRVPKPVAYFSILARTTRITWDEAMASLALEFPPSRVPVIYGGPLGLEMVVEVVRRCSRMSLESQKTVEAFLERLLVAAVVQRLVSLISLVEGADGKYGTTPPA